jgi:hypothetical protein
MQHIRFRAQLPHIQCNRIDWCTACQLWWSSGGGIHMRYWESLPKQKSALFMGSKREDHKGGYCMIADVTVATRDSHTYRPYGEPYLIRRSDYDLLIRRSDYDVVYVPARN